MTININNYTEKAKPFLKWAGGKTQIINELGKRLPNFIKKNKSIDTYIEPFIGGGAFFFYLKNNYEIKNSYILDINKDLILTYKVIQKVPKLLIKKLKELEHSFLILNEEKRKEFYYNIRSLFNKQLSNIDYNIYSGDWNERAAYLIFLNKTCFNGLFRVNRKGEFNVPFGRYKNPKICDEKNILVVSKILANTVILNKDFSYSVKFIKKGAFVYLDPPYRPLNKTSNFTSYTNNGFSENDQLRLVDYFKKIDSLGAYVMLSNSDPKNEDANDNFFETNYSNYTIERVNAKRYINSKGDKRGILKEIIIRNYE